MYVMKKLKIAFDVDDTLIVPRVATKGDYEVPNYENIAIYKFFQGQGHHMIVWSGSGKDWAETWSEKLGLFPDECFSKADSLRPRDVDIAFDDCDVELAKVNVKVKRVENSVSRADWNNDKQ